MKGGTIIKLEELGKYNDLNKKEGKDEWEFIEEEDDSEGWAFDEIKTQERRLVREGGINSIINTMRIFESKTNVLNVERGLKRIFSDNRKVKPGFSSAWVVYNTPMDCEKILQYQVKGSTIILYRMKNKTEGYYYVYPSEYQLPTDELRLIDIMTEELVDYFPAGLKLTNIQEAKSYIQKYSRKRLYDLARTYDINLGDTRTQEINRIKYLSEIISIYTAGMGILEVLLKDDYVTDIYIDAPTSNNNAYILLGNIPGYDLPSKFKTNVILTTNAVESLLSRLRYESGRPFSEAMPVLECDLSMFNTRATVIGSPLSPKGIGFALRRHKTSPWTLLRLIQVGSITPLAAGLMNFLIDGQATILVAGSRGAGKTTLLSALMLEFPQSQRILTIEDTLELPVDAMQNLGYKVQALSIQSSLGGVGEMTASNALVVSMRLGESAIVLGEVRGAEAKVLYEAMRAGTAGSSVMGTFHANSAKSVFERIVHDMGISPNSFLATDIVLIAGLSRPSGAQKEIKRVTQIAEVKKVTSTDPDEIFENLMLYSSKTDRLMGTDILKYRSEVIGNIANRYNMRMEDALKNIEIRAKIRHLAVKKYNKTKDEYYLSPECVSAINNAFWSVINYHNSEYDRINYDTFLKDWYRFFKRG